MLFWTLRLLPPRRLLLLLLLWQRWPLLLRLLFATRWLLLLHWWAGLLGCHSKPGYIDLVPA